MNRAAQRDNMLAAQYQPADGRTREAWRRKRRREAALTWAALVCVAIGIPAAAAIYCSTQAALLLGTGTASWLWLLICETRQSLPRRPVRRTYTKTHRHGGT